MPSASGSDPLRGLRGDLRARVEKACDLVSEERICELIRRVVDIASPTGHELPLARTIAATLGEAGIESRVMPLDEHQGNAWGRLTGDGSGPSIMLYAPIDTVTSGTPDEDMPWIGEFSEDLHPRATVEEHWVTGLGASNPKGHAACILAAMEAIAHSGGAARGDIIAGFGAGGMPTNSRPGVARRNTGQGVGASFLLEQGVYPDFACVAKPGWAVSWEEVGLMWFNVTVHGAHTYVGSRHRLPYANPVALTSNVVLRLEEWFPTYTERHRRGLVAPQGMVANVHGGWARTAAFTPEQVRIMVDLRLSPGMSPREAEREFRDAVRTIAAEVGVRVDVEVVLAIPSTSTHPGSWLVQRAIAAWEAQSGRSNPMTDDASGATDAVILRSRGVPTVRVGMPKVRDAPFEVDFSRGMNTTDLRDASELTKYLIRLACEVSASTLEEAEVR